MAGKPQTSYAWKAGGSLTAAVVVELLDRWTAVGWLDNC